LRRERDRPGITTIWYGGQLQLIESSPLGRCERRSLAFNAFVDAAKG
jgi:hypothetical protein